MTYTLIAHQELTSSQSTITLSSIPQTFDDLIFLTSLRSSEADIWRALRLQFNSSSSGYSQRILYKDSSAAYSMARSDSFSSYFQGAGATANTFGNNAYYIPSYKTSSAKSFSCDWVNENNSATQIMGITAGLWNDAAAITSIQLIPEAGSFVTGSSVSLYGIIRGASGGVIVS